MRNVQVRKLRHREGQSLAPRTQQGKWKLAVKDTDTSDKTYTHHVPACSPGVPPKPAVHRAADTPRSAECRPRRGWSRNTWDSDGSCARSAALWGHWKGGRPHRGSLEKPRQEYRGMEIQQQGTGNGTGVNRE